MTTQPVIVDARGLSCPVPVINTKKALESTAETEIVVLLDEEAAKENVTRLAGSLGYSVEIAENAGEFTLTLRRGQEK
jgi:tRNA 2-thiouridine synthesizing protein A